MKVFSKIILLACILLPGILVALYLMRMGPQELPVLGQVGEFELTDSKGEALKAEDMAGKIWLADFIFTSCQGPCPLMTKEMGKLHNELSEQEKFRIVTVTVDPERDNPTQMKRYAKKYNADTSRWHFLTGERKDIKKLMTEGLKLGSAEEIIFHSEKMVLVDDKGQIRGYYHGTAKDELKKLRRDIATLLGPGASN